MSSMKFKLNTLYNFKNSITIKSKGSEIYKVKFEGVVYYHHYSQLLGEVFKVVYQTQGEKTTVYAYPDNPTTEYNIKEIGSIEDHPEYFL